MVAAAPPVAPKAVIVVSIGVISGETGTGSGGGSVCGTTVVDITRLDAPEVVPVVPVLILGVDSLVAVLTVLSDTVDMF